MDVLFIEYPTCSTCRKAKNFLLDHGVQVHERHIVAQTPSVEELREWQEKSQLDLKKFFNTSGKLYKELHLKDALPAMKDEEKLQLLASNGMLIKRPLCIYHDRVLVGFQEKNYEKLCSEV